MPEEKELAWRSKPQQEADEIRRVNREQDEKYADSFDRQWDTPEQPKTPGEASVPKPQRSKLPTQRRRTPRSNHSRSNQQGSRSRSSAKQQSRRRSVQQAEQRQPASQQPKTEHADTSRSTLRPMGSALPDVQTHAFADTTAAKTEPIRTGKLSDGGDSLMRIVLIILAAFGLGLLLGLAGILIFRSCNAEPEQSSYVTDIRNEHTIINNGVGKNQTTTTEAAETTVSASSSALFAQTAPAAEGTGPETTTVTTLTANHPGIPDVTEGVPADFPKTVVPDYTNRRE